MKINRRQSLKGFAISCLGAIFTPFGLFSFGKKGRGGRGDKGIGRQGEKSLKKPKLDFSREKRIQESLKNLKVEVNWDNDCLFAVLDDGICHIPTGKTYGSLQEALECHYPRPEKFVFEDRRPHDKGESIKPRSGFRNV